MQPFERLKTWQCAHRVAVELYQLTVAWRDWEPRSQLRRCSTSIAANIAEGAGSGSRGQFMRFLGYAFASATELRYHSRYARDTGLLAAADAERLDAEVQECRRMLTGLIRAVRSADRIARGADKK